MGEVVVVREMVLSGVKRPRTLSAACAKRVARCGVGDKGATRRWDGINGGDVGERGFLGDSRCGVEGDIGEVGGWVLVGEGGGVGFVLTFCSRQDLLQSSAWEMTTLEVSKGNLFDGQWVDEIS